MLPGGTTGYEVSKAAALSLPLIAIGVTIVVGVYMAHPWGDNYAYQNPVDYLVLAIFLAWAATPYLFLFRVAQRAFVSTPILVFRLVAVFIVCIGGVYLMIDTAFFNIDAQGGLIFLFLPVYQWLFIGVYFGFTFLWRVFIAPYEPN